VSRQVIADWVARYEKPDYYQWAIVVKSLGEPIGSIASVKQDDKIKKVEIGYCIGKQWWHKGYTSEALVRLVRFFFEDVRVNRIESRHDPRNPNSGLVMLKAGLRHEGTFRQSDWSNQGICDASHYAILAEDYFGGEG
jgi:ribosomal-protein-alanine N-acetyltransferase